VAPAARSRGTTHVKLKALHAAEADSIGDGTVAADGPLWSADGKTLWVPQTKDLLRFTVAADGTIPAAPTVITLETVTDNLTTGLTTAPDLPSGMELSPDGSKLYVALNGVNELGVIDTSTMPDPGTILVSIGRDNALAVYGYSGAGQPVRYEGLLPTDFYPVAVAYDKAIGKIVITNDKGIGARGPDSTINKGPDTAPAPSAVTGHNTYGDTGSLTEFTMPDQAALGGYTDTVFVNNNWQHLLASTPLTNCTAAPAPVPSRLGCPSPIKHVFLIVRENRTRSRRWPTTTWRWAGSSTRSRTRSSGRARRCS
jgi:hypothetical protein